MLLNPGMVCLKVIPHQLIHPSINIKQQKCSARPNLHIQNNHLLQSKMIKPYRKSRPCSQTGLPMTILKR